MLPALVLQVIDHFFAGHHIAANMRERLAEGAGDQVNIVPGTARLDQTPAAFADHARAMRIVYHEPGTIGQPDCRRQSAGDDRHLYR